MFFRWNKQHLHIRAFYCTSPNAVKNWVWETVTIYVLAAILKKQLQLDLSLYKILQILNVSLFERTPLSWAFSKYDDRFPEPDPCIQFNLFNL